MGTNNGHNGTSGEAFLNNPDIVEDFSYRAYETYILFSVKSDLSWALIPCLEVQNTITNCYSSLHVGTIAAKKLIRMFYGTQVTYSYFLGCSLGGRMGIKAAEIFPEDYDGIVAGCPAVDFNNLQGQRAMFYMATGGLDSDEFITADTWKGLIHKEVMHQCDGLDGVEDGIIEVPEKCLFDPQTLRCRTGHSSDCLTPEQIRQVQQVYAPYTYSNGTLIFPRMNPGNEEKAVEKLLSGRPFSYSVVRHLSHNPSSAIYLQ